MTKKKEEEELGNQEEPSEILDYLGLVLAPDWVNRLNNSIIYIIFIYTMLSLYIIDTGIVRRIKGKYVYILTRWIQSNCCGIQSLFFFVTAENMKLKHFCFGKN